MFDKLLVPLDGSDAAEIVLPYVVDIARAFSNEITLATAEESGPSGKSHLFDSYLTTTADELRKSVDKTIKVNTSVLSGKPAEAVVRYARDSNIDLIIIAGHGASGGSPLQLGNIALRILSASATPVLLVRKKAGGDAAISAELIKRIMVPLDGSELSRGALDVAVPTAVGLKAELVLFQAVEPIRYVPGFETMTPNIVLPSNDEIKSSAARYLEDIEQSIEKKGAAASSVVVADAPAEAILDYADRRYCRHRINRCW
jgi:nucleotide-binding universal stress UspA family protein